MESKKIEVNTKDVKQVLLGIQFMTDSVKRIYAEKTRIILDCNKKKTGIRFRFVCGEETEWEKDLNKTFVDITEEERKSIAGASSIGMGIFRLMADMLQNIISLLDVEKDVRVVIDYDPQNPITTFYNIEKDS